MVRPEHFRFDHLVQGVAGICAALFAIAALQFPALANTSLGLMLLAMLATPGVLRAMPGTAPLWLLAAFVLFCAIGLGMAWPSDHRAADADAVRKFLHLWWFVPLAWWIGASERRALLILALAGAAFVAGCLLADTTPSGDGRMRLGFSSINHFAQYAAVLLLGIVCLAPRVWRHAARWRIAARIALVLIGCAGAALAFYWVLASGARGVWLALLLTVIVLCIVVGLRHGWSSAACGLAILMIAATLAAVAMEDSIGARLAADADSRRDLLAGEFSAPGEDALGLRVRMLQSAIRHWQDAPWMGHGPASVEPLLAGEPGLLGSAGFRHLHNVFLDTAVRIGVVGSVLIHALFLWPLLSAWRSWHRGHMSFDLWLATSSILLLALLCNQTDLRMFGWDWRNFWVLVAAVASGPALAAAGVSSRVTETIPERNRHIGVTAP